eukprot:gene41342-51191_t
MKTVEVDQNKYILQIWDSPGEERFRASIPLLMEGNTQPKVITIVFSSDMFMNLDEIIHV